MNQKRHKAIKDEHFKLLNEELNRDEVKEENNITKFIKRFFLLFIFVFLLFLFLSYLLPSYNLFEFIPAHLDSYKIENNFIDLHNGNKISFRNDSYEDLLNIYNQNQRHEFKACLIGKKIGNDYIVDGIKIPRIISQSFFSVRANPCPREAIISLHSHPYKSCYLSVHDTTTYEVVRSINKDAIIGIMCESGRFNFYGQQ